MQSVTAALSESLTPAQVSQVIVDQGIAALGAHFAMVALLDDSGTTLKVVRVVGCDLESSHHWHHIPLDAPAPLAEAVRTGQPIWTESSTTRAEHYPHLAALYARQPFAAWISIPLMVEGRALGAMSFGFTDSQSLDVEDQTFILSLAQQCAQAINRTHLYEAEQVARSEAEAANRIKDEFLAVLSHELRSPLNPILGWTKLLQTQPMDAAKTAQALATIERNAKLQTQLIEDLLDVSRILQGKMVLNIRAVNLKAVIEAAIETVQLAAIAKQIHLHTTLIPNVGMVSGDSARLQQVVWNLLSNAVKFTPPGGQIDVRLEAVTRPGPEEGEGLPTAASSSSACAQITITDTGKGIRPEFLPYVFDYFRQEDGTTTRKFGGLGLGLAIARHLTELHGGTVQAESLGEGQGATFIVQLPLTTASSATSLSDSLSDSLFDLSTLHILIVDDEADMRDLIVAILENHGARVSVATSATEVLALLDQTQPDVLISDIGMPDTDGYMLIQQIRQRSPQQGGQILAIALTAYASETDQQQAIAAGFHRHIAKPVEPDQLVRAIATLIHQPYS